MFKNVCGWVKCEYYVLVKERREKKKYQSLEARRDVEDTRNTKSGHDVRFIHSSKNSSSSVRWSCFVCPGRGQRIELHQIPLFILLTGSRDFKTLPQKISRVILSLVFVVAALPVDISMQRSYGATAGTSALPISFYPYIILCGHTRITLVR